MGSNFWWVFDAVSVAALVFCIHRCRKKGFSRIIVTAIGCVVSLIIAWVVSENTSGLIYDSFVKEKNITAVETAVKEFKTEDAIKAAVEKNELSGILNNDKVKEILEDKRSLDLLYEYANTQASDGLESRDDFKDGVVSEFAQSFADAVGVSLPPYVANEITEHISENRDLFYETLDMLLNSPDKVPQFIEENYIRGMAEKIISSAVFLIVFFVLMTIIILVAGKSIDFGLLNGYDRLDKAAGAFLGLVAGIAIIMIISMAVKIMVNMEDNENSFISMNTIEKTVLFKHFYSFL